MENMIYDNEMKTFLDVNTPQKPKKNKQKPTKIKENEVLRSPLISEDLAKIIQEKFSNLPLIIKKKKSKKPLKIVSVDEKKD